MHRFDMALFVKRPSNPCKSVYTKIRKQYYRQNMYTQSRISNSYYPHLFDDQFHITKPQTILKWTVNDHCKSVIKFKAKNHWLCQYQYSDPQTTKTNDKRIKHSNTPINHTPNKRKQTQKMYVYKHNKISGIYPWKIWTRQRQKYYTKQKVRLYTYLIFK